VEKIKLMTDSGSDISYENEARYAICIIPFKITVDGKSYTSRVDFNNDQFYALLENSTELPATSQITLFEFCELYEKFYVEGYTDLIYVAINSRGSSTYENAVLAVSDFYEAHPEAEGNFAIHLIDSGLYTGCYGYAVVEAAKLLENGADAAEVVDFLSDWCKNGAAIFAPYTLKYAALSGRIPAIAAQMGTLLGIKPLMRLYDHEIVAAKKVRSESRIIGGIVEMVGAEMVKGTPYCVVYGSDTAVRDEMAARAGEALGYPPADYFQIGQAIAINAGPKVSGIIFRKQKA